MIGENCSGMHRTVKTIFIPVLKTIKIENIMIIFSRSCKIAERLKRSFCDGEKYSTGKKMAQGRPLRIKGRQHKQAGFIIETHLLKESKDRFLSGSSRSC